MNYNYWGGVDVNTENSEDKKENTECSLGLADFLVAGFV